MVMAPLSRHALVGDGRIGPNDLLEGGAGADTLSGFLPDRGGPDYTELLSYATSNAGVSVNLATGAVSGGHAQGDVLVDARADSGFQTDFDGILGSTLADTLTGSAGNDLIEGGAGTDVLDGGGGTDYATSNAAVSVNLATNAASGGHAQGDTLTRRRGARGAVMRSGPRRRRGPSHRGAFGQERIRGPVA